MDEFTSEAEWAQQEALEEAWGRTHAHLQLLEMEQEALDAGYPSLEAWVDSMERAE